MIASAIFIGGTGRSGTTLLRKLLARHPRVREIQVETRFLVDPGGLSDFVDNALSGDPYRVTYSVYEFRRLIDRWEPIVKHRFDIKRVRRLFEDMVSELLATYSDDDPSAIHRTSYVCLANEIEFIKRVRVFTSDALELSGEETIIEKTPSNALNAEFLRWIVPGSIVVAINRDKKETAGSLCRQKWGPGDYDTALAWVQAHQRRMAGVEVDSVSLKELLEFPLETVNKITAWANISPFDNVAIPSNKVA